MTALSDRRSAAARIIRSREALLTVIAAGLAVLAVPSPKLTALVVTVSIGLLFVVVAGGIDFSVGPLVAFAAAFADDAGFALVPVGLVCGFANGLLVIRTPIPPYLVTLGMCAVLVGVAPHAPATAGGGFPVIVWVAAIIAVVAHVVTTRTKAGLRLYFVGSNIDSARMSGIEPDRVRILAYTTSGALAALAGVLAAQDLGNLGTGFRLDLTVLAAVVIGGASLSGGRGTVLGTVLGSVLGVQLLTVLDALRVTSYGQQCIQIVLLLLVVAYNERRRLGIAGGSVRP